MAADGAYVHFNFGSTPQDGRVLTWNGDSVVSVEMAPLKKWNHEKRAGEHCHICNQKQEDIMERSKSWVSRDGMLRTLCYDCIFEGVLFAKSMLSCEEGPPLEVRDPLSHAREAEAKARRR
jgi:hypothetical protein